VREAQAERILSAFQLFGRYAESMNEIRGALRVRGGGEYRAAVTLHDFQ
jgi:hypothetical protein